MIRSIKDAAITIFITCYFLQMQLFFIAILAIGSDSGIVVQTLKNTLSTMSIISIMISPMALLFVIVGSRLSGALRRTFKTGVIVIVIVVVDLSLLFGGGYSVSRTISNHTINKEIKFVNENHPKLNPENIKIGMDYYYNKKSQEVYFVKEREIIGVDKKVDEVEKDYIYTGYANAEEDIVISVIQAYSSTGPGINQEITELMFRINHGNYVYSEINSNLFQNEDSIKEVFGGDYFSISKNNNEIKVIDNNKEGSQLEINPNNLSLLYKLDGVQVLSRSLNDKTSYGFNDSTEDIDILSQKGSWTVHVESYSKLLSNYIRISNIHEWINE